MAARLQAAGAGAGQSAGGFGGNSCAIKGKSYRHRASRHKQSRVGAASATVARHLLVQDKRKAGRKRMTHFAIAMSLLANKQAAAAVQRIMSAGLTENDCR